MNRNRFDPLTKGKNDGISSNRTNRTNSLGGLKFITLNINSIRGKKLDLLTFLDVHNPHIVAIQETKIDSSIATSEYSPSRKLLRIKVTPDLRLTYSKNGGNLGLVLKMKNIACLSILLTKHVKYTYLYLFKLVLYSIVAFKAN